MITEILDAHNPESWTIAGRHFSNGLFGAVGFNGICGFFANRIDKLAISNIFDVKGRGDPKIGVTAQPEDLVSLFKISDEKKLILLDLWKNTHSLAVRLPAADSGNCVFDGTIIGFWTEYAPLRGILREFKKIGGVALAATSANRSGEGTHWKFDELIKDFDGEVPFVVRDDRMTQERNTSTTILDGTRWAFDQGPFTLFREGSVRIDELRGIFKDSGLSQFEVGIRGIDYKPVEARRYFPTPVLVPV